VGILPGLALAWPALRSGRRLQLVPLAAGALLWLFPFMGFVFPRPVAQPSGPVLRVLSYNTSHTVDGVEGLREILLETRPDLVLFQWTSHLAEEAILGPGSEGWTVRREGQFTVACRYPIRSVEPIPGFQDSWVPGVHAIVETPLGELDVFEIRPKSAREEIGAQRHRGLRARFGEFFEGALSGRFGELASRREAQLRAIAEEVARAGHLVLLAGDSNLPGNSLWLRRYFGGLRDVFAEAGWGFGYTHPAKIPWMRLDRVMVGPGLRGISFEVLPRHVSGHRAIVAVVAREGPGT
jgi:vancomycin resistance protein VanJ